MEEINEVIGDVLIYVLFLYSWVWFNRVGFKVLGIDEIIKVLEGSWFEKDFDGKFIGVLLVEFNFIILYVWIGFLFFLF